jgi:glutamate--cysteine ligase
LYTILQQRLLMIQQQNIAPLLKQNRIGLEKESLRVNAAGRISTQNHPPSLGSALTHPYITTDYSESLLELVTPPCNSVQDALDYLYDIEAFVHHQLHQQLNDEFLWGNSMPCVLNGEKDIRIAHYGSSNAGRMKHIYRQGLAWRYGKIMQVIAGVHFNYSLARAFWSAWYDLEQLSDTSLQSFINEQYMAMTRNIQRYGWLIPYLFGSSPAVCRTFLAGLEPPPNMRCLDNYTLFEPEGTSLRMGDIGYTNRKESKVGIKANYNSLEKYTASLERAISTPCPNYEAMGVQDEHGEYRQLNAHILQIENEYYSSVRPKQVLQGLERPIDALRKRGIEYVELRSVDISPFHPAGLTYQQLCFLEVFMIFCALQDSPKLTKAEQDEIDSNQSLVAHRGRLAGLRLLHHGEIRSLKGWGNELMQAMLSVADVLDGIDQRNDYRQAVQQMVRLVDSPDATPSAHVLQTMRHNQESFFAFAKHLSLQHQQWFLERGLSQERDHFFSELAQSSLQRQQQQEAETQIPFADFLANYFAGHSR